MSKRLLEVDPERSDSSKIARAAQSMVDGEVAVLPTDTNYAFTCRLGDKKAIDKIHQLRNLSSNHTMTLLLPSFSSLGKFSVVDNIHFRLLKDMIPGPYTFILSATKEVPKAFSHPKRKTVGIRIPYQRQLLDFMDGLGGPMVSTTLKVPGNPQAIDDLANVLDWVCKVADFTLDIGPLGGGETSIIDLADSDPVVLRKGVGDVSLL